MRDFKLESKSLSIVKFTEQASQMKAKAEELCRREIPKYEHQDDEDFVTGYFVFKNYCAMTQE